MRQYRCNNCKKDSWSEHGALMHHHFRHGVLKDVRVAALLQNAPHDKIFRVADGSVLRNTQELLEKLNTVGEKTLRHHVTPHRNDFATWLRDVFGNEKIADDLENSNGKKEMQVAILRNL